MPREWDGGRENRKQTNYKPDRLKDREFVNDPPLNGFEMGQVLFIDFDYEDPADGRKTRPAIFLVAQDRHVAIVRPLYSRPRDDRVAVVFNRKECYAAGPVAVGRSAIRAKTFEIIEWNENDA